MCHTLSNIAPTTCLSPTSKSSPLLFGTLPSTCSAATPWSGCPVSSPSSSSTTCSSTCFCHMRPHDPLHVRQPPDWLLVAHQPKVHRFPDHFLVDQVHSRTSKNSVARSDRHSLRPPSSRCRLKTMSFLYEVNLVELFQNSIASTYKTSKINNHNTTM